MTTEYYQIPSQQGFLPLEEESPDPWLASATSSLSLNDWNVTKDNKQSSNPLDSLFEPEDAEALVSWKNVVPNKQQNNFKAPVAPKQFISTTSKIDAWSVVDANNTKQQKKAKQPKAPKQAKQQPQPQQQPSPVIKQDANEKPIEDELSGQNRYKTELCKSFTETGNCRYGTKCQFAHGKEEVRPILRHPKYKTEICKTFHTTGTCPYGIRCRFIHTRSKEEVASIVKQQQQQQQQQQQHEEEEEDVDDDELVIAQGLAVPQWSKSWTMSMAAAVPSKVVRRPVAVPEPAF